MVGAMLWKMILNSGVGKVVGDQLRSVIVTAPIIVDSRSEDMNLMLSVDRDHLDVPFPKWWIEGSFEAGLYWGAYVVAKRREDGGHEIELLGILYREAMDPRPFYVGGYKFSLDSIGNTIPESRCAMMDQELIDSDGQDQAKYICLAVGAAVMDAMQMLGCKNVFIGPHPIEAKDANRAAKRYGGNPEDYRYHTLFVRPAGTSKNQPGIDVGTMPRHMCRGHFAEYGEQFGKGKLFGKYEGRFYIPPHLKGNSDNGTVEKDYVLR